MCFQRLKALCYLRLSFWNLWQEKLNGEGNTKQALNYANEAKDLYHDIKNYGGQAEAYLMRAQCESVEEKIQEVMMPD